MNENFCSLYLSSKKIPVISFGGVLPFNLQCYFIKRLREFIFIHIYFGQIYFCLVFWTAMQIIKKIVLYFTIFVNSQICKFPFVRYSVFVKWNIKLEEQIKSKSKIKSKINAKGIKKEDSFILCSNLKSDY